MPTTVLTPPATLPVTLAQIKTHLRLDHSQDDDYLLELANAATDHVEHVTRHVFIVRTVREYFELRRGQAQIELMLYPLVEIEQITGYDRDGNAAILPSQHYSLIPGSNPAGLKFNAEFDESLAANGLEVEYRCGHGESGLDVPSGIIRALLILVGHWYEHRGTHSNDVQTALLPGGLDALLKPLRRVKL